MITAIGLQAEGRRDPLGVSTPRPTLSWKLSGDSGPIDDVLLRIDSAGPGYPDNAREIRIADPRLTWTDWPFAALTSRQALTWSVGVRAAGETVWSEPARIEAPLWTDEEWGAASITHPAWGPNGTHHARTSFPEVATNVEVREGLQKTRLYLTANGVVDVRVDGVSGLPSALEPGYARSTGETPAAVWDLSHLLTPGAHRLTFSLGGGVAYVPRLEGRYTKYADEKALPSVRARLELVYQDGATEAIVTGPNWESRQGPTMVAHWYGGEDHDETAAGPWEQGSAIVDTAPAFWRSAPPVIVDKRIVPKVLNQDAEGRRLLDLGVNAAGRPLVRTGTTKPGTSIRIAPAELLDDAGRIDQSTTGTPIWDSFMVSEGIREWRPAFVYHGGRYLEVDGLDACEPDDAVQFDVLRAGNHAVQDLSIDDPFLQRLHNIIDQAVRSNMFNVFTDCPHREKLGWLEQLHFCFDNLARGYEVQSHLNDTVGHIIAAQTEEGLVPNIAPELVVFNTWPFRGDYTAFRDDPNWGRTIIELPWKLYRQYGDLTAARAAAPAVDKYLAYLEGRSYNGLLEYGLGDWIEIDDSTPVGFVATWGWARALDTAADLSATLGDGTAASQRRQRADQVWAAWRQRYRDDATGQWGTGSQACHALALDSSALAPGEDEAVFHSLLSSIDTAGNAITVGEIALPSLISALSARGRDDVIYQLIKRDDVAGYGHQLASGATSLTESWQANSATEGVASQNHFMLSAIDEWIVGRAAGLRRHPDDIGWRRVIIDPAELPVHAASLRYESPAGLFDIQWHREDRNIILTYQAPPHVELSFGRHVCPHHVTTNQGRARESFDSVT